MKVFILNGGLLADLLGRYSLYIPIKPPGKVHDRKHQWKSNYLFFIYVFYHISNVCIRDHVHLLQSSIIRFRILKLDRLNTETCKHEPLRRFKLRFFVVSAAYICCTSWCRPWLSVKKHNWPVETPLGSREVLVSDTVGAVGGTNTNCNRIQENLLSVHSSKLRTIRQSYNRLYSI